MKRLKYRLNLYHKGISIFLTRYAPKKYKSGFTLIELMVVISIISLLSSIVLVSVKDVREKAKVKKYRAEVNQFITALELYKASNNGLYPGQSGPANFGFRSILSVDGSMSNANHYSDSPGNSYNYYVVALSPYLKSLPKPYQPGYFSYIYSHNATSTRKCYGDALTSSYTIIVSSTQPGFEDWPYSVFNDGLAVNTTYHCFSLK